MKKLPYSSQFKSLRFVRIPLKRKLIPVLRAAFRRQTFKSTEGISVTDRKINSFDGSQISIKIIEPVGIKESAPCLFYIHGGGFIFPAAACHYNSVREYAVRAKCKVIFPEYRLAPDFPYPTAHEDCFSAYSWALTHADELGIDASRIAVAGDSAGGCLAAGVSLMARDRSLEMPCYMMLIYPVTDRRMRTRSAREITSAPIWDRKHSEIMWRWYTPDINYDHIEYTSPAEALSFAGMSETYIEVADFDSLRDEGTELAERLKEAGVDVEYHLDRGTVHGFETVWDCQITQDVIKQRCEKLAVTFSRNREDAAD